ncbi:hypothetical protein RHMOL_Rhmol12G0243100 [Rhododendron molle]|uniref:Uncharacterized protein n=1 Tax=Rhododendron molle TaxID=49168 RepID=A0ACC0LLQ0_RHOML|nr:hypothetical protein RHMOL_Rhmol12G0243100 [Rhododendron molle]
MRIKEVISEPENIVELFVVLVYKANHASDSLGECHDNLSLDLESVEKVIKTFTTEVKQIYDENMYDINGVIVKKLKLYDENICSPDLLKSTTPPPRTAAHIVRTVPSQGQQNRSVEPCWSSPGDGGQIHLTPRRLRRRRQLLRLYHERLQVVVTHNKMDKPSLVLGLSLFLDLYLSTVMGRWWCVPQRCARGGVAGAAPD